ncbi:hypothetical protein DEIPH_ctg026orf0052 [Deinococcus phoenicis]|uniref:BioF2-like acetyltransferase domain-containing protein n=2 Tax=Deinococcus phoenicis TaxID=1476583 RepID=A0A016QQ07_9DEIO|nr:hypothetical protein DEIPH_ctg026orf0052 [Deinococcus phoenicis]
MIFQLPWWLDAVAPHAWDEVQLHEGGQLVARWPFQCRARYGLRTLTQPMLCPRLGPWLADPGERQGRHLAQHKERLCTLIDRLPPFDRFAQSFSTDLGNWLPFYWRGFSQTTHYTYRFESLDPLDQVRRDLKKGLRSDLSRAAKQLEVRESDDVEQLCRILQQTYQHHATPFALRPQVIERAYRACQQRQAGRILIAVDEQERVHAVDFYVWDDHCMYALARGRDFRFRNAGAPGLLLWHEIEHAARLGLAFDFHGSMIESVESFLRGFGAHLTPYSRVTKTSGRRRALEALGLGRTS